jgi:hypothetical protein
VDKVAKVFHSFEDADRADEAYYANLTPQERLDILLDLIEQHRRSLGETDQRLERVYRVTELSQS